MQSIMELPLRHQLEHVIDVYTSWGLLCTNDVIMTSSQCEYFFLRIGGSCVG